MKALKANRMITIDPKKQEEYLAAGYTIMDDNEKVIKAPDKDATKVAKEVDELKKQLAAKDAEIAKLNAYIAELATKDAAPATGDDAKADEKKPAKK